MKNIIRSAFFYARLSVSVVVCSIGSLLALAGLGKSVTATVRHEATAQATGTWTATGSLNTGRGDFYTAPLLPNGKVLVVGGNDGTGHPSATAELYDPESGKWTTTGSLNTGRFNHKAILLPNGKVLVAGGYVAVVDPYLRLIPTASAELYDPATGTWTATGDLNVARAVHTMTLLPNGKVLVAGEVLAAELYDPASETWTITGSLTTARGYHTATLLLNGKVLVAGDSGSVTGATAELYDPATGTWTPTGNLVHARSWHQAALLPDGKVLVAGGIYDTVPIASAELYDPTTGTWIATASLATERYQHTATLLPSGNVLVAGGDNYPTDLSTAELYEPATGTWTAAGSLAGARSFHTATLLPNGDVLVAGGRGASGYLTTAELYHGPETPPALLNISTRMRVLTGDQVLIGGFIVTGTDLKRVLIRGIGPSLNGVGVTLSDPTLELHQGTTTLTTNDNWKTRSDGTSQQADIEATTIAPTNDSESAILATLSPGAYTAILADRNGGEGVGLVEVYDLGQGSNSTSANISTRGFVDTGNNVLIGGIIVGGGAGGDATVIVRAIGPSLPVTGKLADPLLELHNADGSLLALNDNWRDTQAAEITATGIPPTNDAESAIVATLMPAAYTAIVKGVGNTTGIGLVEVYGLK